MDKGKKINWKNGLLFSAVSYLLYIIIWLVLDYETARQLPEMALIDYMVDFLLCMLFTYTTGRTVFCSQPSPIYYISSFGWFLITRPPVSCRKWH